MNNAPIGVFDSGSGGLSIMLALQKACPQESIVYLGDQKNNPYGGKTQTFIRARVLAGIKFFLAQHCKMIVIACNTATIAGIEYYRDRFPEIPIVGVVPVVKTAAEASKSKHFVVLSTEYTAKSMYQKQLIVNWARHCEVESVGSSKLVPLIENGLTGGRQIVEELQRIFQRIQKKTFDVVALGCTHYPFIRESIQKIVGHGVTILDSSDAVARQVMRILTHRKAFANQRGHDTFFTTGDEEVVAKIYKKLLGYRIPVTHVEV